MIELDGLRITYGRTVALESLTLEIFDGVTGVFGPNGSGKSSLLRAVAGLLRPTEGRILLNGVQLRSGDEATRRRIGYAGHLSGLYARLSVRENLELFGALYGVAPGRVDDVLAETGMAERAGTRVGALSAGLKRRAAVARALVHEPDVLLLDEPYANLDDEASELVSGAVRRWGGPGRVGLIATHGAKRVKAFADAGIILRDGVVVSYRRRTGEASGEMAEDEAART